MTRIDELKQLIHDADTVYWSTGEDKVSDAQYEQWVTELRSLDPEAAMEFGSPRIVSGGKIKHPAPMLSMDKVYSVNEIYKWLNKYAKDTDVAVMPKYDGIALVRYKDKITATRGNGKVGEDATFITSEFMRNEKPGYGEAVIKYSTFEQLKQLGYQHPRNAVSGILGSLEPEIQERAKYITFVRYDSYSITVHNPSIKEIESVIAKIQEERKDYPMDGIVFRIIDNVTFEKLGHTTHHWRGQIAFKFKRPGVKTVVKEIFYRENNGTITPMVAFDPVFCDGAWLSKASCSNWDKLVAMDIQVGDECIVERAGGVIPYIISSSHTVNSKGPFAVPTSCPTCNANLIKFGKRLYCPKCDK